MTLSEEVRSQNLTNLFKLLQRVLSQSALSIIYATLQIAWEYGCIDIVEIASIYSNLHPLLIDNYNSPHPYLALRLVLIIWTPYDVVSVLLSRPSISARRVGH